MKKIGFIIVFFFMVSYLFSQTANIQTGGSFRIMEVREVTSTNQFIRPDENMRFIAFDILVDNTNGNMDINFNLFMGSIEVRDSEGRTYTPDLMSGTLTKPEMNPNATIEAGDLIRGWMTIQIPQNIPINGLRIRINAMQGRSDWITIGRWTLVYKGDFYEK